MDFNGLINIVIGGALALSGVYWTHYLQKKEATQKDAKDISGLLQAFQAEIEILWEVYQVALGANIANLGDDKPMLTQWPLTLEYFTIYSTNAASIGRIRNHELQKQIITTYTRARSMIDSVRLNNELLQKWEYHEFLFEETHNPVHQSNAKAYLERLNEYAKVLKESHSELESMVPELLQHLRTNPQG